MTLSPKTAKEMLTLCTSEDIFTTTPLPPIPLAADTPVMTDGGESHAIEMPTPMAVCDSSSVADPRQDDEDEMSESGSSDKRNLASTASTKSHRSKSRRVTLSPKTAKEMLQLSVEDEVSHQTSSSTTVLDSAFSFALSSVTEPIATVTSGVEMRADMPVCLLDNTVDMNEALVEVIPLAETSSAEATVLLGEKVEVIEQVSPFSAYDDVADAGAAVISEPSDESLDEDLLSQFTCELSAIVASADDSTVMSEGHSVAEAANVVVAESSVSSAEEVEEPVVSSAVEEISLTSHISTDSLMVESEAVSLHFEVPSAAALLPVYMPSAPVDTSPEPLPFSPTPSTTQRPAHISLLSRQDALISLQPLTSIKEVEDLAVARLYTRLEVCHTFILL